MKTKRKDRAGRKPTLERIIMDSESLLFDLNKYLEDTQSKIESLEGRKDVIKARISALEKSLESLNAELPSTPEGNDDYTCGYPGCKCTYTMDDLEDPKNCKFCDPDEEDEDYGHTHQWRPSVKGKMRRRN